MHHDLTGTTIADRYHLLRRIGQGGFATVYEALDRKLDKKVAVKVLSPRFAAKEEYRRRFVQEARAAARLRHRLLVDVTDHGVSPDGLFYFVMEHLQGISLGERLREQPGPLPWRQVVAITIEVVKALEVAHQHGIVHRDVKPGNVFLVGGVLEGPDLQVKLLDLGIAKVHYDVPDDEMPETRESQGAPGTPEYMAPEQITGGSKGPSVDLYAVGILMYRLLTGALPFTSKTNWEVLRMHVDDPPVPPCARAPEAAIPPALEAIVLRLMAKRPEGRHASATELRLALLDLLQRTPTPSLAPPPLRTRLLGPERVLRLTTTFMRATLAVTVLMLATLFTVPAASRPQPRLRVVELTDPAPDPEPRPTPDPKPTPTPPQSTPATTKPPPAPEEDDVTLDPDDPTPPNGARLQLPVVPKKPPQDPGPRPPSSSSPSSPDSQRAAILRQIQKARPAIDSKCKKNTITKPITAEILIDLSTGIPTVQTPGDRSPTGACLRGQLATLRFRPSGPGLLTLRETFDL